MAQKDPREERAMQREEKRREPLSAMRHFMEELDRAFFGRDWPSFEAPFRVFEEMGRATWTPRIDVIQRENEIVILADLPGMRESDIKLQIEDDVLTISGGSTLTRCGRAARTACSR